MIALLKYNESHVICVLYQIIVIQLQIMGDAELHETLFTGTIDHQNMIVKG